MKRRNFLKGIAVAIAAPSMVKEVAVTVAEPKAYWGYIAGNVMNRPGVNGMPFTIRLTKDMFMRKDLIEEDVYEFHYKTLDPIDPEKLKGMK